MSESTLTPSFSDLYGDLSLYAYETTSPTDGQKVLLKAAVNRAYRQCFIAWDWPFLRPEITFVAWATATGTMTVSGDGNTTVTDSTNSPFHPGMIGHSIVSTNGSYVITAYTSASVVTVATDASADTGLAFTITADGRVTMADNVDSLIGVLMHAPDVGYGPLEEQPYDIVADLLAGSSGTSIPREYCFLPAGFTAATGQRQQVLVYPIPSEDYTLYTRARIKPAAMTADAEYPLGGPWFAELVLARALALWEGAMKGLARKGPMADDYKELLPGVIGKYARQDPTNMGNMGNGSGRRPGRIRMNQLTEDDVHS